MIRLGHPNPPRVFLVSAGLTLVATIYITYLLPDSLLRFVLWVLTHSIYRIKVEGRDNIPERGGALFVSNHMSFVDACLLIASTDRTIRFVMFKDIYEHPIIHPFARILRCIPISSQLRPREMIRSLRTASEAIQAGEVVCIFAEGQITRIGHLLPFRRGFERIMKGVQAPIVPVNLDGVWGSIFSFDRGRFLWKLPRQIPYPVTVSYGKPMPPTSSPFEVRQAVQDLHAEAYRHHKSSMRTLDRTFLSTARRHPLRMAMADERVKRMSWGGALNRTIFLALRLRSPWHGQKMVGILLPPSIAGALVNFAALLMGKVPVNLNYTASAEVLASCAKQCQLETVLTSKAFLERVPLQVPGRVLLLEELAGSAARSRTAAGLLSCLARAQPLAHEHSRPTGAHAARRSCRGYFFQREHWRSQGRHALALQYRLEYRTDRPDVYPAHRRDRLLGILPFFHSFGFTVTLWLARGASALASSITRIHWTSRPSARWRPEIWGHVSAGHTDLSASVPAPLRARGIRQRANGHRGRGKTS